mmetsp:Transcript_143323/g.373506  ORF Transcript_143323/g.373506 Transcript_143323/m.373506 type:complete len:242 (+) Transcript_143323:697-1422(+)
MSPVVCCVTLGLSEHGSALRNAALTRWMLEATSRALTPIWSGCFLAFFFLRLFFVILGPSPSLSDCPSVCDVSTSLALGDLDVTLCESVVWPDSDSRSLGRLLGVFFPRRALLILAIGLNTAFSAASTASIAALAADATDSLVATALSTASLTSTSCLFNSLSCCSCRFRRKPSTYSFCCCSCFMNSSNGAMVSSSPSSPSTVVKRVLLDAPGGAGAQHWAMSAERAKSWASKSTPRNLLA